MVFVQISYLLDFLLKVETAILILKLFYKSLYESIFICLGFVLVCVVFPKVLSYYSISAEKIRRNYLLIFVSWRINKVYSLQESLKGKKDETEFWKPRKNYCLMCKVPQIWNCLTINKLEGNLENDKTDVFWKYKFTIKHISRCIYIVEHAI